MILDALDRYSALASRWLYNVGVFAALPALLGLVTLEVVLRYVFLSPLEWSRDANGLLLLITLFSALPRAWDRGYHIRMEVVHVRLPRRYRVAADVLAALAGFVFFVLLSIQAIAFAGYMLATGETGEDFDIPLWPFMVFVAICGVVLSARLLANPLSTNGPTSGAASEWI